MKKLLAIVISISLLFAFASCGADKDSINNAINSAVNDVVSTIISKFALGEVSGQVYENEYIGIGCQLSNDWVFYSEDQIKELNNMAAEIAGEDYKQLMENADVVYDMMGQTTDLTSTVELVMEKFDPSEIGLVDLKFSLEATIPTLTSTYEGMGFSNVQTEITTLTFAGEECDALNLSAEINGYNFYLTTVMLKADSHVVSVGVGSFNKTTVDTVLSNFYALN